MTEQLWPTLMAPLVAALTALNVEQAVLIPGSLLGLLPLHAAWHTDKAGQRRYALDDIAFSYAPSAAALSTARRLAEHAGTVRLLAVDEPTPVDASPLPNAAAEVVAISSHFAEPTILRHASATRQAALEHLASADVFHAACHGKNDPVDPLQSALWMAGNEPLTAQDFFNQHLAGARLAALSACETGIIGTTVPDEVVALPSALLQAGFAGVVASLWSVYDASTALLLSRFYVLWREEGKPPAVALAQAQRWLRNTSREGLRQHQTRYLPEMDEGQRRDLVISGDAAVREGTTFPYRHPVHWAAFYLTGV